ncbi:substrate-binding domain-containing protein [Streptomyces sp. NPDC057565]|uniref:substrate-binding domain-containing protein n=1 Tax=Streptomyces sp. NPDC057565 TaxID=3346169 RepID=UPI003674EEAF
MRTWVRDVAVMAALLTVTSCEFAGGAGVPSRSPHHDGLQIGLLLSNNQIPRWEKFDRPFFTKRIGELCGDCTVRYANAGGDLATQVQQIDSMISDRVDVLVIAAVNGTAIRSSVERAEREGVPVVAYGRLIQGPIAGYVTSDITRSGEIQAQALLHAMAGKGHGDRIVMLNGAYSDPSAAAYKKAALSVFRDRGKITKSYDVFGWRPDIANSDMSGAIASLGADRIDGVYAANDGMASGAIAALKAAKVQPLPPVVGQNADLTAVQSIVRGDQYMTVYNTNKPWAETAAAMALALGRGAGLDGIAHQKVDSPTTKDIPAVILKPVPVTVGNIKDTLVKDGMYTIAQICTPKLASACQKAGLLP